MDRLRRICVLLLLVSSWCVSLLGMAYPARAQAPDGPGNNSGVHVVEAGETLNAIAREYGTSVNSLLQLNGLDNANVIHVGQQLVVAGGENGNGPEWQGEERSANRENASSYQESAAPQHPGVAWEPQPQERTSGGGSVSWSNPDGSEVDFGPEHANAGRESQPAQEPSERWASSDSAEASQRGAQEGTAQEPPSSGGGSVSWSNPDGSPVDADWQPESSEHPGDAEGAQYQERPDVSWSSPDDDEDRDAPSRQGVAYDQQPAQRSPYAAENNTQQGYETQEELTGEKWIDVDISEQQLIAYQGDTVVRVFSVSTGATKTPTVVGSFRIYAKIVEQDMSGGSEAAGDYYYQEDVPWVQYFFEDYSIHGAYWHNMFGQRTGHGCVNMRVGEAQWLFNWAEPEMDPNGMTSEGWLFTSGNRTGTRVEVHE